MTEADITSSFVREYLEELPCSICTKGISDDRLEKLIEDVSNYTKQICRVSVLDFDDEDIEETWFNELEHWAIVDCKMDYYEDLPDE